MHFMLMILFFVGGEGRRETYGVEMDKERHQLELDKKRIMQPSLAWSFKWYAYQGFHLTDYEGMPQDFAFSGNYIKTLN